MGVSRVSTWQEDPLPGQSAMRERCAKHSDFFARRPEAPVVSCTPFTNFIVVVGGHSSLLLLLAVASSFSFVHAFEIRSIVLFDIFNVTAVT